MDFMALHVIRRHMPDDRLVNVKFWDDGVFVFEYRYGFISPALVHGLSAMSRGISHSGALTLDYELRGHKPEVMAWFEAGNLGIPLAARVGEGDGYGLPMFFEIQVDSKLIDPAAVREANYFALPSACQFLLPRGPLVPA